MKKAFTMIELIFVIVILGILAAVALPKFLNTATQAHEGNLKDFEGTLNRTVAATAWAKVVSDGGSLAKLTGKDQKLSTYVDIPKEFTVTGSTDANLSNTNHSANDTKDILGNTISCNTKLFRLKIASGNDSSVDFNATAGDNTVYVVDVCDGSTTQAPRFYIVKTK